MMTLPKDKYGCSEYLRNNPTWDIEDSSWKAKRIVDILATARCRPSSICDVGCGAGGILAELRQVFPDANLFGYDIAPNAARFWSQYASARIAFELGDCFEMNHMRYDFLLLLDVIEHLEDPFDFLDRLRKYARTFVFHIPLDLSAINVLRERPLLFSRLKVGHIHYFTKGMALALLKECAYDILEWSYTEAAFTTPKANWKTKLANLPRRVAYSVNKDWGVRLLGGETLMVLARAKG